MSRSLKNLLSGLLCRDPKKRFKWHDVRNSPWCTEVCSYVDISGFPLKKKRLLSNSVNSNKFDGATFHTISIHILCYSSLFFLIFSIDLSHSFSLSVCLSVYLSYALSFSHFLSFSLSLFLFLFLSLTLSFFLSLTLLLPVCLSLPYVRLTSPIF